jgi:hypothetical protein
VLSDEGPAQAACSALDYVGEGYADQTPSLSQLHRHVVGWPGLTAKGSFASPCAAGPRSGWGVEVSCIAFFLMQYVHTCVNQLMIGSLLEYELCVGAAS